VVRFRSLYDMALVAVALNTVGVLLLAHSQVHNVDTIELLVSTVLITVGVVLASPKLRPITWSEWAAEIERHRGAWRVRGQEGDDIRGTEKEGDVLRNPYQNLEARMGFWDVRSARKEFANWVRKGGKAEL
jgi:membrane magnesium transporter 1